MTRGCEKRLGLLSGLSLAAHWHAALDRGLVSFDDAGRVPVKPDLSVAARALLAPEQTCPLSLEAANRVKLAWHFEHFDFAHSQ